MTTIKELQRKRMEIIMNFEKEDLENYIMQLSHKYHAKLLKKDSKSLEEIIETLSEIMDLYKNAYPDIHDFIDYCLFISGNDIFMKVFELNCKLWTPNDKSLEGASGFKHLTQALEDSRLAIINDECNVKELYDLVCDDETISEEISDKVEKLYNSFRKLNLSKKL